MEGIKQRQEFSFETKKWGEKKEVIKIRVDSRGAKRKRIEKLKNYDKRERKENLIKGKK